MIFMKIVKPEIEKSGRFSAYYITQEDCVIGPNWSGDATWREVVSKWQLGQMAYLLGIKGQAKWPHLILEEIGQMAGFLLIESRSGQMPGSSSGRTNPSTVPPAALPEAHRKRNRYTLIKPMMSFCGLWNSLLRFLTKSLKRAMHSPLSADSFFSDSGSSRAVSTRTCAA
jgi:hypothetical protein